MTDAQLCERVEAEAFLRALVGPELPEDERMILCGFSGDPHAARPDAWRPRPWRPGNEIALGADMNAYVTVASFRRAGDGSFRRRTETFAAGRALMIDDVGTKVPANAAWPLPSARIETSPGNQQWWYFLDAPERDVARFDGVIRAFIAGQLLGADPGMAGVNRVGRLPGFVNAKPAYGGHFRTNIAALEDDRRFSVDELLKAFNLTIFGRRVVREKLQSAEAIERNRAFATVYKFLRQRGMLKKAQPDPSGWSEVTCFNVDHHTGKVDNGAAIREPSDENSHHGAFHCCHGGCADLGWAELTEWCNDLAVEELTEASEAEAQR